MLASPTTSAWGNPISAAEFVAKQDQWLLSEADNRYLCEIMKPVTEPGKVANWIAPPSKGIGGQGPGFDYVRA